MSGEKEVVPEANGKEDKEDETNPKDLVIEESNIEEANEKENVNQDAINLEPEIIRQVEYYFGDVNLPRDKFLLDQIQLDDGWVPLEILTRFNRLSKLSKDIDIIENALKKSKSGIIEVADKKVRRNPNQPVPVMDEDRRKEITARTVYAKGFAKDTSLDEILGFFKKYDEVENVIMRRYLDLRTKARPFKGSVFATFKTKDQADKFMAAKDSVKYKDTNLLVLWQEEYGILKQEERKDRQKRKDKKIKLNEKPVASLPTGTVLYFEDGHEKMTREEIKTALSNIDKRFDIAFIDFKIGLTRGWIRFSRENAAVEFLKLLNDGNIVVGEHNVVLKLLEGDEEKEYLDKTIDEMAKRRRNMKTFKNKGKNNYKGKHIKRRRDDDGEEGPPTKVKCDS